MGNSYDNIHQGDIEFRLSNEYRNRYISNIGGGVSIGLLLLSFYVPETSQNSQFSWLITILILFSFVASLVAKTAQNQIYSGSRVLNDIQNAYNQARVNRAYEHTKAPVTATKSTLEKVDGDFYIDQAVKNWQTHLGVLSPTGTGKTTTLELFLSRYTATRKCLILAVEPKDNQWKSLPTENVFRISVKPTITDCSMLINLTQKIIEECDKRNKRTVDGLENDTVEIILILEEYLTIIKSARVNHGPKIANALSTNIKSILNVGRSAGIKTILVSQSPVADDIDMSGGERANLRLMLLGNVGGGFEAIDRGIDNSQIVSSREDRERLLQTVKYFKQFKSNPNQPIMMANFSGKWEIVKVPFVSQITKSNSARLSECFPGWRMVKIDSSDFEAIETQYEEIENVVEVENVKKPLTSLAVIDSIYDEFF